jgi:prolyl-tRNA editing enzyme YbaK/EbsC (Cys-tRNA(Pro) deacylase)
VADAAAQLGCEIGAIANSLVFTADGEPLLVLASGAHRVNVKRLATYLGVKKVRRAESDFVYRATAQHVGGVAPVGHPRPIKTLIDETLSNYEVIWAGAGTESAMFATSVAAQDILRPLRCGGRAGRHQLGGLTDVVALALHPRAGAGSAEPHLLRRATESSPVEHGGRVESVTLKFPQT